MVSRHRAISSVWLERLLDTQEVTGSIPASPTDRSDYYPYPPEPPEVKTHNTR